MAKGEEKGSKRQRNTTEKRGGERNEHREIVQQNHTFPRSTRELVPSTERVSEKKVREEIKALTLRFLWFSA